jgi:hypothetical protein
VDSEGERKRTEKHKDKLTVLDAALYGTGLNANWFHSECQAVAERSEI